MKQHLYRFLLLFCGFLPLTQPSMAWAQAAPKTEEFKLSNGFTVLVKPDRRAPTAVQMVWVRVGSMDEVDGASGLAHMLEQRKLKPDYQYSVIAFTDGKNTVGRNLDAFKQAYEQMPEDVRGIPVFMVLYGDAAEADLKQLVAITGGRVFDARKTPLYAVFKDIRSYQ